MKAFFFLPTLMILLCSWSLPKLNTTTSKGGKIIKAPSLGTEFLNCTVLFGHDTTEIPEFSILRRKGSYEVNTVVIDPGHGGHDPGCHGTNSKEKHVCLAVGKYLEEAIRLNFPGVKVILTRSTDVLSHWTNVPLLPPATKQISLFPSIAMPFRTLAKQWARKLMC